MTYHLLLKTAESEMRAWAKLSQERKASVTVFCEITRGRKKRNIEEYNIDKVYKDIENKLDDCQLCFVDITREESLSSPEIEAISTPADSYSAWRSTVDRLARKNSKVRPTLIVNPDEDTSLEQYQADLQEQFDHFATNYSEIAYRASVLFDDGFTQDLEALSSSINHYIENGNRFLVVLDFEYIQPSSATLHAGYALQFIREIRELTPNVEIISVGTSFPRNVTEIGDEDTDTFRLAEVELNRELNRLQNTDILYGDYGSINPIRNDAVGGPGAYMRARIDFPTDQETIYYYRVEPDVDPETKTLNSPRSVFYKQAARLVSQDARFAYISNCWGYNKIVEAAESIPEGSSPSFWISVRMEIHLCRQIDRINRAS